MNETEIFERHLHTGFDIGWHRDIPRYTPDDWEQFLILAYKIWELAGPEKYRWGQIYASIPRELWSDYHGENHQIALRNIISPLGQIHFHPKRTFAEWPDLVARAQNMPVFVFGLRSNPDHFSGLSEILSKAFDGKWNDETRKKFISGLQKAKNDPLVGEALAALETFWLEPVCERRGLTRERVLTPAKPA